MKYSILSLTILICLSSCGVSQKEYDDLKNENEKLRTELDELKNGPDRLLNEGKALIESKKYQDSKNYLNQLIEKHPVSSQASEAKTLLTEVDRLIELEKQREEKERIENEKAEKKRIELEQKAERDRLANATKKLKTKYDDIRNITWYYDKSTPTYTNYNSFHLYMGKEKSGRPWLRFRIQYTADDWLFIESYIIKTDNGSHRIDTKYGEVEKDNDSGDIWEWYDVPLNNETYGIIKDVINSKTVKLRYNGKQYYNDRTITATEKQGLKNILDAYEALGGQLDFN
jgi:hypothetical protein